MEYDEKKKVIIESLREMAKDGITPAEVCKAMSCRPSQEVLRAIYDSNAEVFNEYDIPFDVVRRGLVNIERQIFERGMTPPSPTALCVMAVYTSTHFSSMACSKICGSSQSVNKKSLERYRIRHDKALTTLESYHAHLRKRLLLNLDLLDRYGYDVNKITKFFDICKVHGVYSRFSVAFFSALYVAYGGNASLGHYIYEIVGSCEDAYKRGLTSDQNKSCDNITVNVRNFIQYFAKKVLSVREPRISSLVEAIRSHFGLVEAKRPHFFENSYGGGKNVK